MAERTMTDADIEAIVKAMQATTDSHCRYDVAPDDLAEAVRFFKNVNEALENSRRTVWNTLLVLIITGLFALLGVGFWSKLRGG